MKISICRSGSHKRNSEAQQLLLNLDSEKQYRQKRAEVIKRLTFTSDLIPGLRGDHREILKHIKDDLELYPSDDEENERGVEEIQPQYTDAFREGNLIIKVFDGDDPNPVCWACWRIYLC
jgi:hypothetical protein